MQLVIFKPINPMDTVKYQQWQNNEKVDTIGTVNDAFMELKRQSFLDARWEGVRAVP